jgi:hypothetical protein
MKYNYYTKANEIKKPNQTKPNQTKPNQESNQTIKLKIKIEYQNK